MGNSAVGDMLTRVLNNAITLGIVAPSDQTTITTLISEVSAGTRQSITQADWVYIDQILHISATTSGGE
jgi:hypothetical protein